MSLFEIKPFDPVTASREAWDAWHFYRRLRHAEDEPDEPIETDAENQYNMCRAWPLYDARRFLAWAGGEIVGSLRLGFRRPGDPDEAEHVPYVQVGCAVAKDWRRRRVATALLQQLLDFMRKTDRTVATFWTSEPDGHAFLAAIGASLKHQGVQNRLRFSALDWDELARWQATAETAGLAWEIHAPRVPLDRLEAIVPEVNRLFADVPFGSLDMPPVRWELSGFRTYYEELDRHGGAHYLVLLTDGGEIAALCEAAFDARYPDRIYQNLTAVARPWRGRGLAKGVKARMLLLIRERHPDVRLMITGNAQSNDAMLAINHQLGFREYKRDGSYQIGPEALGTWLAGRTGSTG